MGILEPKKKRIVLLNYPLVLSLLKYRNVWIFWNKKKKYDSNRCNPLNSNIENPNRDAHCSAQTIISYGLDLTTFVIVKFTQMTNILLDPDDKHKV